MVRQTHLSQFLPTSVKEARALGWEELDVILFSGDAYVDHPSFAAAVVGRLLQSMGLRVAIVPQPNWRDDLRDFKKMGRPRLFFGVSPGAMDSMVNKYTAAKRLRSEDAYTPDKRIDMRPEYPSVVYTQILKKLFPDIPVILGGIEASLRRLTHYDYWQDRLLPPISIQSGADLLIYGMGEQPLRSLVTQMEEGKRVEEIAPYLPQVAYITTSKQLVEQEKTIYLNTHEECLQEKRKQAENFCIFENESNRARAHRLIQACGEKLVVVNPPFPPMTTEEIDRSFDLPYTRLPHPRYAGKVIPAYEMIKHSVNLHRGCFGGCAFCTISAHQGKQVVSRSEQSILREVRQVTGMEDFKGYLSDVGGPSANMYNMRGRNTKACEQCVRPSCIFPSVCPNLNADHKPLNDLLEKIDALPEIKKSFVGSGVRYDLLLHPYKEETLRKEAERYMRQLITHHTSGRLKVAPEHVSDRVLTLMRKPPFSLFYKFNRQFEQINQEAGLKQQLIPYFISSHPGCQIEDMAQLAIETKQLNFKLEQVQDFTPTPMTLATEMYYTGLDPHTMQPVYCAIKEEDKKDQRRLFFWYQPEERSAIIRSLRRRGQEELAECLFGTRGTKHHGRESRVDKYTGGVQEKFEKKHERLSRTPGSDQSKEKRKPPTRQQGKLHASRKEMSSRGFQFDASKERKKEKPSEQMSSTSFKPSKRVHHAGTERHKK